ncbi:hypothetical protein HpBTM60_03690 [Helicobacter pylori]
MNISYKYDDFIASIIMKNNKNKIIKQQDIVNLISMLVNNTIAIH